ncbi:MAG TPA: hypothetical protein VGM30_12245 [Puia sp.]
MQRNFCRRSILSALLALSVIVVRGQYNIVALTAGPVYLKSQLWNLTVSNTSNAVVSARIQLDMMDLRTHQSVFSAMSAPFHLSPGAMMIQMQAIEPIQYSYTSSAVTDRSANGMLPIGQYQVCYQLLLTYGENQTVSADDCEEIAVEPLSPPLLTMPENDSSLTTPTPSFTWLPPAPLTMFSELTYDLLISEVYDGQSVTDAIQKNLPLQQAQGLTMPFLSFPLQGPQLEKGKTYAWQVIARDRQQYAAKSEVWSFKVPDTVARVNTGNSIYLLMDGHSSGPGISDSDAVHVKFVSSVSAYQATILVKDDKGTVLRTLQLPIRQGDNYLDIPLTGSFQRKHTYGIQVQDGSGRSSSMSFTIK